MSDSVSVEVALPMARVKRIVRSDPEVKIVSHDALYLIAKATELFIASLSEEAFKETQRHKRKGIKYDDLATAVKSNEEFEFLSDIVPEKQTVASLQHKERVEKEVKDVPDEKGAKQSTLSFASTKK